MPGVGCSVWLGLDELRWPRFCSGPDNAEGMALGQPRVKQREFCPGAPGLRNPGFGNGSQSQNPNGVALTWRRVAALIPKR